MVVVMYGIYMNGHFTHQKSGIKTDRVSSFSYQLYGPALQAVKKLI